MNRQNTDTAIQIQISLAEALQFDDGDLGANREGRLSENQRARLRQNWYRGLGISFGLIAFGVVAATVFLFLGWRMETVVLTLVGIALTFFNAAVVGLLAQAYLRYRGDTQAGTVIKLEGSASRTLKINERARSAAYFVKIGGQELRVNKPVFNAFHDHGVYCIYRAVISKQILSAEQINP
ncbi:MAG: hypothetical protein IAE89_03750 [Anaerolineae bacterium]|nr:hypothetical protein [Anaerolineae bacterium]